MKNYLQVKSNYISSSLNRTLSLTTQVTKWLKRWKSLHDIKFAGRLLKSLSADSSEWKACFSIGIALSVVYYLIVCFFKGRVMAEANIRARYSYVSCVEQIWGGAVPSSQGLGAKLDLDVLLDGVTVPPKACSRELNPLNFLL